MNSIAACFGAIVVGGLITVSPQKSFAEGFTGKDFAKWQTDAQDNYIQTSVTMAGVVLTQVQPEKSTCIDQWYLGDGQKDARNAHIRDTITQYADYHPSGTILAILLEACGPLK